MSSRSRRSYPRSFVLFALVILGLTSKADAQEGATPPRWIWSAPGSPKARSKPEIRYFRKAFSIKEPSRVVVEAAADESVVLSLDGKEIARATGGKPAAPYSATLATGEHVLAAQATKAGDGPGGFILRGGILPLGQGVPIHTDRSWRATDVAPTGDGWLKPGFDDRPWAAADDLGVYGVEPWKDTIFARSEAQRFQVKPGFVVDSLASPKVTGSVIAFTFDEQGQPCVSVERDSIFRLIDSNQDGVYDTRKPIAPGMNNCQGLSFIKGKLYAVGQGPAGTGLYRLTDANHDAVFEQPELVRGHDGQMGEHGPHAVMMGPDGKLYHNVGNHAHLKEPIDPRSPVAVAYEGELLPHYNDSRGHAVGIMAPGGEIYRSDDEGASWTRVSAGYRNHYDFAFNRMGDLFSFDSDMEWDQGLPWYRPTRVTYAPIGSEFGWRNGSAVWPDYFFDSLPPILELGRGSPTGVTFYQGNAFPPELDDALLLCDWSQGRILAVKLKRTGASYSAESQELVSGQPLNCTDLEVGPDGGVYFTTGGRNTEGGLYRIRWLAAKPVAKPSTPIDEAIRIASPLSSFSQARVAAIKEKLGAEWAKQLTAIVFDDEKALPHDRIRALDLLAQQGPALSLEDLIRLVDSDANALVRARGLTLIGLRTTDKAAEALARALRDPHPLIRLRAVEGLIQQLPYNIPVDRVNELLKDADRFLRSTARTAIEHSDIIHHRRLLVSNRAPRPAIEALLALVRASRLNTEGQDSLLMREMEFISKRDTLSDDEFLDALRVISLTFELGKSKSTHAGRVTYGQELIKHFPSKNPSISKELARLLAFSGNPQAVAAILKHQASVADRAEQIHYAYCLRVLREGWTSESKQQFWRWFQTASGWDGGFSFLGYLDFMIQDILPVLTKEETDSFLAEGEKYPFPTRVLVRSIDLDQAPESTSQLLSLYRRLANAAQAQQANDLRALILETLGRSSKAEAREALRILFKEDPARRDLSARALAARPTNADLPFLVQALETLDPNTASSVVSALKSIEKSPEGASGLRNLLMLARRTGSTFVPILNELGRRWTGEPGLASTETAAKTLAYWEQVYARSYPREPLPAAVTTVVNSYSFEQLLTNVLRAGLPAKGSPERGKLILARARCLECHKFGAEGAGLGPDLTTLNSRFRPTEIMESIANPSVVISDQYKSLTVATTDGKIYTGMPVVNQGENLVLLLSDGTKATIPVKEIEERKDSRVSVMPEGLLNAFSYEEIGDLIALFLSQPKMEQVGK